MIPDIIKFLSRRRSIRKFQNRPVGNESLEELVQGAAWAPSASNRQAWFFTIVKNHDVKVAMAKAVSESWQNVIDENVESGAIDEVREYAACFDSFRSAPAVIAVSCRSLNAFQTHLLKERAEHTFGDYPSAAMAAQNLMLTAEGMGLGSCCMTGAIAAQKDLKEILGLSRKQELVCLIAVGYPDEQPAAPKRKEISQIMRIIE